MHIHVPARGVRCIEDEVAQGVHVVVEGASADWNVLGMVV